MKNFLGIMVLVLLLSSCVSDKDIDWSGERQVSFAHNTCKALEVSEIDQSWGSDWHKCKTKYGKVAWEIEKDYIHDKSKKHSGDYISMQEYNLQKKAQEKEDVKLTFSYEDQNGQKMTRVDQESTWTKFWGNVGWILYEYGDEILEAAINAKYGVASNTQTPRMYCVSQRVGSSKIVHTNCRQR